MELWYTQPAADWNAALPAGNGRLGCIKPIEKTRFAF